MTAAVSGPGGTYRVFADSLPTLREAEALIDRVAPGAPGTVELVGLGAAAGRVLARDVRAPEDIPPFDRSTVDGYAIRSEDTDSASPDSPVSLRWRGEVAMGGTAGRPVGPGEAVGVATGGMMPAGADAVVMVENTEASGDTIHILRPVEKGGNVLPRGSDAKAGGVVAAAGTRLGPAHVGALAGGGCVEVPVTPRPVVAILVTGDELVPPHVQPTAGQIRDMNTYSLSAAVKRDGGHPIIIGRVSDSLEELSTTLKDAAQRADTVLVSGGSSVGIRDITLDGFKSIGAKVHVHGIAIKPGKPTLIATLDDVLLVGLPGNPVSALVIYDVLVRRALWKRMGAPDTLQWRRVNATLTKSVRRPRVREELVRVRLYDGGDGDCLAEPVSGTSGMLQSLARADGFLFIPFGRDGFAAGNQIEVWLLPEG